MGMADSIQSDEYSMSLGAYAESTRSAMQSCINEKHLDKLVTICQPLDINPGADDEVHAHMAELMLNDEGIDAVVIGLDPHSPVTHTLAETDVEAFRMGAPGGILERLSAVRERFRKPSGRRGGRRGAVRAPSVMPYGNGIYPFSPSATALLPPSPYIWKRGSWLKGLFRREEDWRGKGDLSKERSPFPPPKTFIFIESLIRNFRMGKR